MTVRLAVMLATLTSACGTKVVDLVLPDGATSVNQLDAMAVLKCETITRADGSTCKICLSVEGMIVSSDCPPSGADAAAPNPQIPPEMCKVVPTGDSRCLICSSPSGMNTTPCLKCEAPVKTSDEGESCRACTWTDREGRCLQCFTAGGMVTHDDCDMLRAPSAMTPPPITPPDKEMTPDAAVMPSNP